MFMYFVYKKLFFIENFLVIKYVKIRKGWIDFYFKLCVYEYFWRFFILNIFKGFLYCVSLYIVYFGILCNNKICYNVFGNLIL